MVEKCKVTDSTNKWRGNFDHIRQLTKQGSQENYCQAILKRCVLLSSFFQCASEIMHQKH